MRGSTRHVRTGFLSLAYVSSNRSLTRKNENLTDRLLLGAQLSEKYLWSVARKGITVVFMGTLKM